MRIQKGGNKDMKKGNIVLLVAAIVIFVICYYYSLGLLTTARAIFYFVIFSSLAVLLIWSFSLLAKNLVSALKEQQTPPYLQNMPKRGGTKSLVVVLDNPWYTRLGILLRRRRRV